MVKHNSVKTRYQFVYSIIRVYLQTEKVDIVVVVLFYLSLMHKQFCNILEFGRHAMTMSVFVCSLLYTPFYCRHVIQFIYSHSNNISCLFFFFYFNELHTPYRKDNYFRSSRKKIMGNGNITGKCHIKSLSLSEGLLCGVNRQFTGCKN